MDCLKLSELTLVMLFNQRKCLGPEMSAYLSASCEATFINRDFAGHFAFTVAVGFNIFKPGFCRCRDAGPSDTFIVGADFGIAAFSKRTGAVVRFIANLIPVSAFPNQVVSIAIKQRRERRCSCRGSAAIAVDDVVVALTSTIDVVNAAGSALIDRNIVTSV